MKILLVLFLVTSAAVSLLGEKPRIFKNYYSKRVGQPTRYYPRGSVIINSDSYTFRLDRKINDMSGIFTPVCSIYRYTTSGGEHRNTSEGHQIIITGRDLTHKVDGDNIPLGKKEILWPIGTVRRPNGRTYRVFSFNKNAKIPPDLRGGGDKVCPNCNGTGRIPGQKTF